MNNSINICKKERKSRRPRLILLIDNGYNLVIRNCILDSSVELLYLRLSKMNIYDLRHKNC